MDGTFHINHSFAKTLLKSLIHCQIYIDDKKKNESKQEKHVLNKFIAKNFTTITTKFMILCVPCKKKSFIVEVCCIQTLHMQNILVLYSLSTWFFLHEVRSPVETSFLKQAPNRTHKVLNFRFKNESLIPIKLTFSPIKFLRHFINIHSPCMIFIVHLRFRFRFIFAYSNIEMEFEAIYSP